MTLNALEAAPTWAQLDASAKPTNEVRRRAIRNLAHHATDAAELAEWLHMIDLDPQEGKW